MAIAMVAVCEALPVVAVSRSAAAVVLGAVMMPGRAPRLLSAATTALVVLPATGTARVAGAAVVVLRRVTRAPVVTMVMARRGLPRAAVAALMVAVMLVMVPWRRLLAA
jgi:hypothetical protein